MSTQPLIIILIAISISGCTHNPAATTQTAPSPADRQRYNPQVVYPNSAAYDQRIASFKFSPNAARELAKEPYGSFGPACVIDDWYLFSKPYKYKRIDLTGTYVNAMTGQVEHRDSELSLLGDNSLTGTFKSFPADMPDSLSQAKNELARRVPPVTAYPRY